MQSASEGYDVIAGRFDADRAPKLWELPYFETLATGLVRGSSVLDCGCGSGHLGIATLIEAGHRVTGLDGSSEMLALLRMRYAGIPVILCDMRAFVPALPLDAIVAWDSVFHLSQQDQTLMIERFGLWLRPGGRLLFTSGPVDGSVEGEMFGVAFSYSSFDEAGYRDRLAKAGFTSIQSAFDEPQSEIHKVWTARKGP